MRRTDPGKADNARGAGKRVGGGVHAPPLPGDTDPLELFERTKAYVGWTEEDSRFLHSIYDQVEPHIDRIVDDFYERILRDPGARRAITEGEPQIARLKQSQRDWLTSLLRGPHDGDFALAQSRIGRVHVKVGLDQIYMVTGAQVFREHLCRLICASQPAPDAGCLAILEAVDKGLTIVLTLMPSFLFSGFLFPIASMPPVFQGYTHLFPARHFMEITRGIARCRPSSS